MTEIEFTPGIRTPKYYIVEVATLREDEVKIKGEGDSTITLILPERRNNDTDGLTEIGIVKSVPVDGRGELLGKKIRFWFLNTDFSMQSGISIKDHVLVPEYDIVMLEDEMYGDWIYCKPLQKKQGLLYIPTIQHISYDSLESPREEWSDEYIDKGVVARKNEHFPEGELLFWGNPANIRQNWDGGYLIRHRYVQACGEDVINMEWVSR
jgi:hypothetical protein